MWVRVCDCVADVCVCGNIFLLTRANLLTCT